MRNLHSLLRLNSSRLGRFGQWTDLTKLCAAIKRFDEYHPAVRLELYSMNVPHLIAALRERRIDVAFVRPPVSDPVLNSEFMLAEPFVVALSKKHRLAGEKRLALSEPKDEPIIMAQHEGLPFFYDLTLKLFQDAGFVPNVHDEVDYPSMVLALVAAGIGVSLVPASIRKIQSAGLVFLPYNHHLKFSRPHFLAP
jgi:DNA-binding transcriptional LysR family regulator